MLFAGGLFLAGLTLRGALNGSQPSPARSAELRRMRRWNLWGTTPALLIVWWAGATLASEGGWFHSPWLHVKLACVAGMSLIHIFQSWRLHRDPGKGLAVSTLWSAGALLALTLYLVGAKPGLAWM